MVRGRGASCCYRKMKKLLYIVTRAERGGGQVHVRDLLGGFRSRYECHLATGEEGFLCEAARDLGVAVHIIPSMVQPMAPLKDLRALMGIRALLKTLKPDLVHAHTSKAGLLARLAGAIASVPVVFTVHAWSFTEGASWKQKFIAVPLERLAGLGGRIITVSESNRRMALSRGVAAKHSMTTVRNGITDTPGQADPGFSGRVRIIMVARFAEPKDQLLLLRAVAGINEDFEVDLVGDGPLLARVRKAATDLGLNNRVNFLGDRDDVADLLARAHIFALATKSEGLPLSILEAMRAGLPVISSDVGGVSESVEDGVTGLLVPAGDPDQLRAALLRLILDPPLRAALGHAGRKRYERDFTVDRMLAKTAEIYGELMPVLPDEAFGMAAKPA